MVPSSAPDNHVNMMYLHRNIRSATTCLLKRSDSSTDVTLCGNGRAHSRHVAQALTIPGMSANISRGTPARSRSLVMVAVDACHHRMCNFLRGQSSLGRTANPKYSNYISYVEV